MSSAWTTRLVIADPVGRPNPALVRAAARAGATGLLDLGAEDALPTDGPCWVRVTVDRAGEALPDHIGAVVIPFGPDRGAATAAVAAWTVANEDRAPGRAQVIAQVVDIDEARAAVAAGATGLLASGSEAGGRIGDTEAFILLQQCLALDVPVWVRGGIGLHTAAGAIAGGAAGVVMDTQLALTREAGLPRATRQAIAAMDGSETRVVGGHRIYTRPDLDAAHLPDDLPAAEVAHRLGADLRADLVPLGQDTASAARLAHRFGTVGGVVQAVQAAIDGHLAAARAVTPLAPGHGVAAAHGTRYPIAQGPMTRVSDRAAFAASVAEAGGLPFLALALLPGDEVRALLTETAELLGDRPWGVGILGFVPPELRAEQLEVVADIAPPVALIAGGRPSQASPLEAQGISTYLHVPSPGLLDRFLKDGARKFIFEGRECGGHVGPRSSFALWDAQIERLLEVDDADQLQILFAGGIHDERSAAIAATAAAPLAARGARIGVLMGTAYLFTPEAVAGGAIEPAFQDVAVHCERTVLLETSPGHATRCVETGYVQAFKDRKAELIAEGVDSKAMWAELESLNLGRLRIASKGLTREGGKLVTLDEDAQRAEGMYMIGEVATLRHETLTVAELHAAVTEGATAFLAEDAPAVSVRDRDRAPDPLDIAIVGMEAFMPGAIGADEFWAEIVAGANAVREVRPDRWDQDLYYDANAFTRDAGRKTPSRWGGFLDRIGFDPLAYGIPPASLAAIEPVQLLSLEVAARALADAGYATREFDRSRASVIFGAEAGNELAGAYGIRAFLPQLLGELPEDFERYLPSLTEDSFPGVLTNVIAGRIANRLDLGGVNYTVDAACASSLAALDAACKELRAGISDLVVCGGADLHNGLNDYLMFASVHALSPTGQCRTFDAAADGIALGEGIAAVVLKRRADAERDGDRIYAVIDAVAGSSDGRHLGLTAPRKEGQQRAVERAWAQAGHPVEELALVEAHGTGTVVGDRTEMATLTELFAEAGAAPGHAVLGSVKSQIGHTKCAAGLAGLIKVARAIHHAVLPPTIGLTEPNSYYDPTTSPFRFLDRAQPWTDEVRRAGVSAFGFGGTNFHTVLSSAPDAEPLDHGLEQWPAELFAFRAADLDAARAAAADLAATVAAIIESDPRGQRHKLRDLADAACAAGRGSVQLAVVADDLAQLHERLLLAAEGTADAKAGVFAADTDLADAEGAAPMIGFLYPGQGSQRPGMLADLFVAFPWLGDLLRTGAPWRDALLPPAAFGREARAAQAAAITATDVAQPTLGIASLALTRVLGRLGITPDVAGGHSYGELAALAAAGVVDDRTLLTMSAARGQAILEAIHHSGGDPGSMAAVELDRDALEARLAEWPDLIVANHNGPTQAVVSGPTASVERAVEALTAEGTRAKQLPVACAFHSPLIAEAGQRFAEHLAGVELATPAFPVWSNTTAEPYPAGATGADVATLLAEQVISPVRFVEQVEAMYAAGVRVFVEAGPGRVLTQQVGKILGDRPHRMVACDASGEHGLRRLLLAVAELATLGVPVDLEPLFAGRTEPIDLRSLPRPRPGWEIDGAFVCTADGTPLPNSLQPADQVPSLPLRGGVGGAGGAVDDTVLEYLHNVRQLVAAERDVMLAYLGSAVPEAGRFDHAPSRVIPATGTAAPLTAEPAAVAAEAGERPVLSGDQLMAAVLAIVSERTGYPIDMLDPDLDLEADLSIDSIKRIEIVGELAERVGLPGMDESAVDEDLIEELAQRKTLRGIVTWIDEQAAAEGEGGAGTGSDAAASAAEVEPEGPPVPAHADRFELATAALGPAVPRDELDGASVAIVGPAGPLADALTSALGRARANAVHHALDGDAAVDDALAAALASADAVIDLRTTADDGADARQVFAVARPALLGNARAVVAATVQGGRPTGVPGLARALAREFPDTLVRSVEIDPVADLEQATTVAAALVDELLDRDAPASLSWVGGTRSTQVVVGPVHAPTADAEPLDADAVVVVTGGARGITARVARALAAQAGCHLVLVGRSPVPGAEDPATIEAADRAELRKALLATGAYAKPAEIEAACDRILADREIRATLADLEATAASVAYHPMDVRDPGFGKLLDEVLAEHGRLDGVIHGAGVLDDRFVRDKTDEGFDRVYGTKVDGAAAILDRPAVGSRFVVLFGSVSGVFGNRGQCDYAAANDTLDALAHLHHAEGRRVISIDWGPWGGGGMVSPELEREYARRGIGLVDPEDGVAALLGEIAATTGAAQVVVMRGTPAAFAPPTEPGATVTVSPDDLLDGVALGD